MDQGYYLSKQAKENSLRQDLSNIGGFFTSLPGKAVQAARDKSDFLDSSFSGLEHLSNRISETVNTLRKDPEQTSRNLITNVFDDGKPGDVRPTLNTAMTYSSPFLAAAAGAIGTYRAKKKMREAGIPEHIIEQQGPSYLGGSLRGAAFGTLGALPMLAREKALVPYIAGKFEGSSDGGEAFDPEASMGKLRALGTAYNAAIPALTIGSSVGSYLNESSKASDIIRQYRERMKARGASS